MNLSKSHGIFSVIRLLEQDLCCDTLLKSQQISVEQQETDRDHCSEDEPVGFGRCDILEFRKLISSVFDGRRWSENWSTPEL